MAGSVPENVIIMWPGANNGWPSGWSRETNLDSLMPKGVSGIGANGGATGGGASHDHATASHTHPEPAHTHTGNTSAQTGGTYTQTYGNFGSIASGHNHTHSFTTGSTAGPTSGSSTPAWGNGAVEPEYYTVIYIKSDGSGDGFPDDSIVYYNSASDPADWTQHAASVGKHFRGSGGGAAGGGSGGSTTHTHTTAGHTHSAGNHAHAAGNDVGSPSNRMANGNTFQYAMHGGTTPMHVPSATNNSGAVTSGQPSGGVSATATNDPPSTKMNAIQNDSGASVWLESAICLWIGTASDATATGFTKCDGNNGTRNLLNQFILNNPSGGSGHGGTSGQTDHAHSSAGHTHTASHSHGGVTFSGQFNYDAYSVNTTSGHYACRGHNHAGSSNTSGTDPTLTTTSPTLTYVSDEQPAFRTVHYLMSGEEPVSGGNVGMFGANF